MAEDSQSRRLNSNLGRFVMSLTINVEEKQKGVFIIKPVGRLDTETHRSLRERVMPIVEGGAKAVILDLEKLEYISSSGLGVIFQIRKAMEADNRVCVMTNLQPQINKIFEIVKTWPGKAIFRTMQEVDDYLDFIQKKEIEKQHGPQEG